MKTTPKTEKEINESGLIPIGVYPFEVMTAEDAVSKKGNEMIAADLHVFLPDGKVRALFAFLMDAMPAQLFHFCTYCGLATEYGSGTLKAADCVGKKGYVKIGIQKGKEKDDGSGEFWPDRNSVQDFVRPTPLKPGDMAPKPAAPAADGDVPY